jgi:hypothetical protein
LFNRQERLDALHEPVEVEELRLGIPVRLLGQLRDDILEVARYVADGDVLVDDFLLQALHLAREAFGECPDGLVFRLLDKLSLAREQAVDHLEQLPLLHAVEPKMGLDPGAQLSRCARFLLARVDRFRFALPRPGHGHVRDD